ncbi:uncharacterized protein LOC125476672 [Pyrus x bretschneideri]|uniref:uncharacterized protein LOC125476672 n=1 Tax=Pyrus x bretschneideri TaxID=225117 RepID=UPI002030195C|nr:uncharacterized protein LOC125476672 [Pyrus x bretschneideri]
MDKLDVGWIKCNFDGAWIQQDLRGGFGAVIQDHRGEFIAAIDSSIGRTRSAFHAELFAARQVTLWPKLPFGKSIIFECDSSLVLAAVKGQDEDYSLLGPIINDLHYLLQSFPLLLLNHEQQGSNSAEHRLDLVGIGSNQQLLWSFSCGTLFSLRPG